MSIKMGGRRSVYRHNKFTECNLEGTFFMLSGFAGFYRQ